MMWKSTWPRLPAYLSLLALALWMPACGPKAAAPPPDAAATAQPSRVVDSGEPGMTSIEETGYIESIRKQAEGWSITIQYADLLQGEAARNAAIEAKEIGPNDTLDSDIYVRESEEPPATFNLRDSVVVTATPGPAERKEIPLAELVKAVNDKQNGDPALKDGLYTFTITADRVIKIDQIFLP